MIDFNEKIEKLIQHPRIRCYCLYVYHWFRHVGMIGHTKSKTYNERSVEEVKKLEDNRRKIHKVALDFLIESGIKENDAIKLLESEIKRLINQDIIPIGQKATPLKEDECFCGLCRVKLKRKDWEKHEKSTVHEVIGAKVEAIYLVGTLIKTQNMIEDDLKELRKELK